MIITYENLLSLPDFQLKKNSELSHLNSFNFLSFQDALHYLIQAYNLQGKKILLPAFYCDATINDMKKHGLHIQLCKINYKNFDIDLTDFRTKLTSEQPDIILIYNFFGKNSLLYNNLDWLQDIKPDTVIISDFAHSLIPNHAITFLNKKHFYIDSTRKTTSQMMAHLIMPKDISVNTALVTRYSLFKISIRLLFFLKTICLRLATFFNVKIFSTLGIWLYTLHDYYIGSPKAAFTGFHWDNFLYSHINFKKIKNHREKLHPEYKKCLQHLADQKHIELYDLPPKEEGNICFFFLRIIQHSATQPIVKKLQDNGFWAEVLWNFDAIKEISPDDRDWAKSIIVLPYTLQTQPKHIHAISNLINSYYSIRTIMQSNPQIWTVNSILNHHYGYILLEDNQCACLKVADFYFIEGVFSEAFGEKLLQHITQPAVVTSSNNTWYDYLTQKLNFHLERTTRWMYQWGGDINMLTPYLNMPLKPTYHLQPIGEAQAKQIQHLNWSEGVFDSYINISGFLTRGFGYCILDQDKIISFCMSFSSSEYGVEIEVNTDPDYQKQNLGKIVSAHFVAEALKRGISPLWDATNIPSVKIAESLGFKLMQEYQSLGETE